MELRTNTAGIPQHTPRQIPISDDEKDDMRISREIATSAGRPTRPPIISISDMRTLGRLRFCGKSYVLRSREYFNDVAKVRQLKNAAIHIRKIRSLHLLETFEYDEFLNQFAEMAGFKDVADWINQATYHDGDGIYHLYELRTNAAATPGQMTLSGTVA